MSIKEYPGFVSILGLLSVYFEILGTFALSNGNASAVFTNFQGSSAYAQHLFDINTLYKWSAVLQDDLAFHLCQ